MSAQSPRPTDSDDVSRRGFLERGAIGAGTVVTLGAGGSAIAPRFSPVGRAQALDPRVVTGGTIVGGPVFGWMLRAAYEADQEDSPPSGLSADGLLLQSYQTALTRQSTSRSTFVDNNNILLGIEYPAYAEGKIAAIEAINNQKTESEVLAAAQDANASYQSTAQENFLKSWNEAVHEARLTFDRVVEHSDVNPSQVYVWPSDTQGGPNVASTETTVTLADDTDFTLYELSQSGNGNGGYSFSTSWDPINANVGSTTNDVSTPAELGVKSGDGDTVTYLVHSTWNGVWSDINSTFTSVNDGLSVWVSNIYGAVQSGELDTTELLTPREMSHLASEDEDTPQAIADLIALNVPTDLEREATITIDRTDDSVTLSGALSPTDPPADGMVAGETYDPSTMSGSVYFTYDVSDGSGTWGAYQSGVDGGVVTFTKEPYENTSYTVHTTAGESATVTTADFTYNDGGTSSDDTDDTWTVDITDQLETAIANIDTVEMSAPSDETKYETVLLENSFTIETFTDSEGNEYDSSDFTQEEPQDDTNYVTKEEWENLRTKYSELQDKYDESQEDDDDGPGPIFGGGDWLEGGGGLLGMGIIGVVILAVFGIVTDTIPGLGEN